MDYEERVRTLEAALEFYANPGDYKAPFTGGMGKLWADCGAMARVALGEAFSGDQAIVNKTPVTPYNIISGARS